MCAYRFPRARSSSCEPLSSMRPSRITTMRSALRTVERRWAMIRVVRFCIKRSRDWRRASSVSASSALDAETEEALLPSLDLLMQNRTTLIIAHRLSTVRSADRIVVIRDGRIEESGSHDELLARGNLYAHMHQL